MARDHKGKLHFPLAIHRTAAQLMVEVWHQVKSELSHRSPRKSKPGQQQQSHLCHHEDTQTVFTPSALPVVKAAAGGTQCA